MGLEFHSAIMAPGLTHAVHTWGCPFPLPIRVAKGFLDHGL